jgi:cytochrome b6-f complex iron-sulfur subunit
VEADLSRRQLVVAAGAGAGALALVGCSGGSGSSSGSSCAAGGGGALATLGDIPVGSCVSAKDAAGAPIVVAQPSAGKAVAFSAVCTHMGCTVAPTGEHLNCPCHGSQYDAFTGAVLKGPATKPLASVPVHVADGKVVAGSA